MNPSNLSNLREKRVKLQQENQCLMKKQKELQEIIVVLEERLYIQDLESKQTQLKETIMELENKKKQLESKLNKEKVLLNKTEAILESKKEEVKIKHSKKSKKKKSKRKAKLANNLVDKGSGEDSSLSQEGVGEDGVELVAGVDSPVLEHEAPQRLRGKKPKKKWSLF